MGRSTHVAGGKKIILYRTGSGDAPAPDAVTWPALNGTTQDLTMTSESFNRRSTDRGYIARTRTTTMQTLRKVLGLLPVTESLNALQHWRRRVAKNES
jgi:hypothetical protein